MSQIRGQHPSTPARGAPVPTELHQHLKGHSDQVSGRVRRVSSAVQRKWPEWDLARLAHDPGYARLRLHAHEARVFVRMRLTEGDLVLAAGCNLLGAP